MNFENNLTSPGIELDAESDDYKTLTSHISKILSKIKRKLEGIADAGKMNFHLNDFKLHYNERFPGAMVISLSMNKRDMTDISVLSENHKDYLVCLKSDGIRFLLAILNDGRFYLIDRNSKYFQIDTFINGDLFYENKKNLEIVYLFDGELIMGLAGKVKRHFQIFDVILFDKKLKISQDYVCRLKICEKFLKQVKFLNDFVKPTDHSKNGLAGEDKILVTIKDFYKCNEIDFVLNKLGKLKLYEEKIDGVIFTKIDYPYVPGRNKGIVKWKPDYLNSIDFLAVENKTIMSKYLPGQENDAFKVFEMFVMRANQLLLFDYFFINDDKVYNEICSQTQEMNILGKTINGAILEANYDREYKNITLTEFYRNTFKLDFDRMLDLIEYSQLGKEAVNDTNAVYTLTKNLEKRFNIVTKEVKGNWNYLRVRTDKILPNGFGTARNVNSTIFEENISQEALIKSLS